MIKKSISASIGLLVIVTVTALVLSTRTETHVKTVTAAANSVPTTSTATTEKTTQPLTLETVAKHNTRSDCWFAINGGVYDVTTYINSHPGGLIIATGCGKDASGLFNAVRAHKRKATAMLSKYSVGKLQ